MTPLFGLPLSPAVGGLSLLRSMAPSALSYAVEVLRERVLPSEDPPRVVSVDGEEEESCERR